VGEVPGLLKPYVWKKPKSSLEALREIVRALPIVPKLVDWRDTVTGVVTSPTIKSTSTELSAEAKMILKEAVDSDGHVVHSKSLNGEQIFANGKSLIPNDEPKTIALWAGGLEDLIRCRCIKDRGHKGEIFEVTREGYDAANVMNEE
jgi:hypothetical protein